MNQSVTLKRDLRATGDMEKRMSRIKEDVARYRRVEQSDELREFRALQVVVETKEFQDRKHYLLTRKYRHTEEFWQMRRYHILRYYSPRVHGYMFYRRNEGLRSSMAFTEKRYRRCAESEHVREFIELQALIATKDFQIRLDFWRNPKRWYTTEESKQDARYQALKESEDIRFFLAQDAKKIAEWERYHLVMEDDFTRTTWRNDQWEASFCYDNPNLKSNHSYTDEQQANNQGKNSRVSGSILCVETRKEDTTAPAWHPTKGFIEQQYHYTGDVLQTGRHFRQAEGLFMAKVRFHGPTHAAVYLGTGTRLPVVSLAQWNGKQASIGIAAGKEVVRVEIEGLKATKWWIYSVVIGKTDIVWYINDQEVLRRPNTLKGAELYPAVATFLPGGAKAGVGKIEVDWVRAYTTSLL